MLKKFDAYDKNPNGTPYLKMMINFEDIFEKNKAL